MRLPFSAIEVAALAGLFTLIALRWRYERACLASHLADAETSFVRSLKEPIVSEHLEAETRGHRAMALMCAAIAFKGEPTDIEEMLSVADEFLQYIEGNDSVMPRPDLAIRGKLPKAGKR